MAKQFIDGVTYCACQSIDEDRYSDIRVTIPGRGCVEILFEGEAIHVFDRTHPYRIDEDTEECPACD